MSTLYREALELTSELEPLLPRVAHKDADLGRRLKRSAGDLSAHLEESMLVTGRARRLELRAAAGALKELSACVRAAKSVGYLEPRPLRLEARIEALAARLVGAEHKRAQAS